MTSQNNPIYFQRFPIFSHIFSFFFPFSWLNLPSFSMNPWFMAPHLAVLQKLIDSGDVSGKAGAPPGVVGTQTPAQWTTNKQTWEKKTYGLMMKPYFCCWCCQWWWWWWRWCLTFELHVKHHVFLEFNSDESVVQLLIVLYQYKCVLHYQHLGKNTLIVNVIECPIYIKWGFLNMGDPKKPRVSAWGSQLSPPVSECQGPSMKVRTYLGQISGFNGV